MQRVEDETRPAYASPSPQPIYRQPNERKQSMKAKTRKQKLTQEQIDAALAQLAEVQQEIKDRRLSRRRGRLKRRNFTAVNAPLLPR